MPLALKTPRTPHSVGAVVKLGDRRVELPPGSDFRLSDDRRLLFTMEPVRPGSSTRALHVYHAGGELVGIPPKTYSRFLRSLFPDG